MVNENKKNYIKTSIYQLSHNWAESTKSHLSIHLYPSLYNLEHFHIGSITHIFSFFRFFIHREGSDTTSFLQGNSGWEMDILMFILGVKYSFNSWITKPHEASSNSVNCYWRRCLWPGICRAILQSVNQTTADVRTTLRLRAWGEVILT